MSGPKVDEYELERRRYEEMEYYAELERRRREEEIRRQREYEEAKRREEQLRQQRELEEARRREREEKERTDRLGNIKKDMLMIGQWKQQIKGCSDRIMSMAQHNFRQDYSSLQAQMRRFISDADSMLGNPYSEASLEEVRQMDDKLQHYQENNQPILHQLLDAVKELEQAQDSNIQSVIDELLKDSKISNKKEEQQKEIDSSKEEDEKANETQLYSELKSKLYEEIEAMGRERAFCKNYDTLLEDYRHKIDNLEHYRSYAILRDFQSGEYQKLKKQYKSFMQEYEKYREPYLEAYDTYIALCEMTDTEPKPFRFDPDTARENIDIMKEESKHLNKLYLDQQQQAYIRTSINDVMAEMGYEVLAAKEIIKKSGRKIKSRVYSFGDGSGINLSESSNGQISMEVVGLEVGINREATNEERDFLEEEQHAFCHSYAIMEEKLKARGIERKFVSHMKPSKENAVILNLDDYEKNREFSIVSNRSKNKRTSSEAKAKEMNN